MSHLAPNATSSLHVLAYLYLRMNILDKAKRTYKTLLALNGKDKNDPKIHLALAFIALEDHDTRTALQHINTSLQNMEISSKNAVIYLLRAKALVKDGRIAESQNAIAQYSYYLARNENS